MSERETGMTADEDEDIVDAPHVEPSPSSTLSEAEMDELVEDLTIEELMEEPPEGELAVISDEDVPGAPG